MALLEISRDGQARGIDDGFQDLVALTMTLREKGRRIFFIGNGASASIASHIAADLCKNGHVKTEVFTDLSLLTALVNDCGVEQMFAEPLTRLAQEEDMLVVISSSGESENTLNAVVQARSIGMDVITFSGMKKNNRLRRVGSLNFYIPAPDYGLVESGHAALLHYWVDSFLEQRIHSSVHPINIGV